MADKHVRRSPPEQHTAVAESVILDHDDAEDLIDPEVTEPSSDEDAPQSDPPKSLSRNDIKVCSTESYKKQQVLAARLTS